MRVCKWKIEADWGHIMLATAMAAAAVWYFLDARDASQSIYNLILIVPCAAAIVALYIVTLILEIRIYAANSQRAVQEQSLKNLLQPAAIRNASMMVLLILYVLMMEPLGFEIASFLFIGLSLLLQGEQRFGRVIIFSVLFSALATWLISTLSFTPIPTSLM